MNATFEEVITPQGQRLCNVTLFSGDGELVCSFSLPAASLRAIAAPMIAAAEKLEALIVAPEAHSLCGVCSGTLRGFNRRPTPAPGGKWVHFGDDHKSYYECKYPPNRGKANGHDTAR